MGEAGASVDDVEVTDNQNEEPLDSTVLKDSVGDGGEDGDIEASLEQDLESPNMGDTSLLQGGADSGMLGSSSPVEDEESDRGSEEKHDQDDDDDLEDEEEEEEFEDKPDPLQELQEKYDQLLE